MYNLNDSMILGQKYTKIIYIYMEKERIIFILEQTQFNNNNEYTREQKNKF